MAKIQNCIILLLFIAGCNNNRVRTGSVSEPTEVVEWQPGEPVENSVPVVATDIPVLVDTAVAMPDSLPPVVVVTTVETDTVEIVHHPSLTEIYTAYIGVREATGKNDGPAVERFLKSVGLGKGYPWCAAFVKTCLMEAGIPGADRINGMALSCENKKHMIYRARQMLEDPEPGDVFTLYYASLKRIGHTGFHHKRVNSSVYESVEGNTSGGTVGVREGDGVYKRKRSYNATHSISRWR